MNPSRDAHLDRMTSGYLTAATFEPGTPMDAVREADRVLCEQVDPQAWEVARAVCETFATTARATVAGLPPAIAGYCLYRSQRGEPGGFLGQIDQRVPSAELKPLESAQGLTPSETLTVWHHNQRMRAAGTAAVELHAAAIVATAAAAAQTLVPVFAVTGTRHARRIALAPTDAE